MLLIRAWKEKLIVILLPGFRIFDNIPFRLGLPESATSGLEKFEGSTSLPLKGPDKTC